MKLTFFRLYPEANLPKKATTGSACFDIEYRPQPGKNSLSVWSPFFGSKNRETNVNGEFTLMNGERVLLPTGLIANIPEGYSLRLHPRSGKSIKEGLTLVNAEGVVDSDYVEEIMIAIINHGANAVIKPGDRLAQAELIANLEYDIGETKKRPGQKTERSGGFGSTG